MPHTYSDIWLHLIFCTKERQPIIDETWRPRLYEYLGGIARGLEGLPLAINGMADHVHMLVRIKPIHRIDYFLRDLKANSSAWVRQQGFSASFAWQRGYGAFSVSESQVAIVRRYIERQSEHHLKKSIEDEFKGLLRAHKVDFDEKYLWE